MVSTTDTLKTTITISQLWAGMGRLAVVDTWGAAAYIALTYSVLYWIVNPLIFTEVDMISLLCVRHAGGTT